MSPRSDHDDQIAASIESREDEMKDIDRAALVAELRRQVREANPKDDSFPWRQANLNLANSLERDEGWLSPAAAGLRELRERGGDMTPEAKRDGSALIAAERQRQVATKDWTTEHDDSEHQSGELVAAAICYAYHPYSDERGVPVPWRWPWEPETWKPTPKDRVRELTKAGALIAAEIDRLLRLADEQWVDAEGLLLGPRLLPLDLRDSQCFVETRDTPSNTASADVDWRRAWEIAVPVVVAARRFALAEAEGNAALIEDAHFGLLKALADYNDLLEACDGGSDGDSA